MTLPTTDDYLGLITSQHRGADNFAAMVEATTEPFVALSSVISGLPAKFDLDESVGVQLDQVGEWVGRNRYIWVPLDRPWFSLDIETLGFDEGIWRGPLSSITGRSPLEDETYRALLRSIILANNWDGTLGTAAEPITSFFSHLGISAVIEDRQDMTMIVLCPNTTNVIALSVMNDNVIGLKPGGVSINFVMPSALGDPVFGFDQDSNLMAGLDQGSWGISPQYVLNDGAIAPPTSVLPALFTTEV